MAINDSAAPKSSQQAPAPPGVWKLILSPRPSAALFLYATIPAIQNSGVQVQKYSSRFGADFEKHTDADGIVTWWRLLRISD